MKATLCWRLIRVTFALSAIIGFKANGQGDCNLGFEKFICAYGEIVATGNETTTTTEYRGRIYFVNTGSSKMEVTVKYRIGGSFAPESSNTLILDPGSRKFFERKYTMSDGYDHSTKLTYSKVKDLGALQRQKEREENEKLMQQQAEKQKAEEEEKKKGTILINCDIKALVKLDGVELATLEANASQKISASQGEHLLEVIPVVSPDNPTSEIINVISQSQIVKQIKLRQKYGVLEDKRVLTERIQKEKEEKARIAQELKEKQRLEAEQKARAEKLSKLKNLFPRTYVVINLKQSRATPDNPTTFTPDKVSFFDDNQFEFNSDRYYFYGDSLRKFNGQMLYRDDFVKQILESRKKAAYTEIINEKFADGFVNSTWVAYEDNLTVEMRFYKDGTGQLIQTKKRMIGGGKSESMEIKWRWQGNKILMDSGSEQPDEFELLDFIPGKILSLSFQGEPVDFVRESRFR